MLPGPAADFLDIGEKRSGSAHVLALSCSSIGDGARRYMPGLPVE
jgi:hypothetical protein